MGDDDEWDELGSTGITLLSCRDNDSAHDWTRFNCKLVNMLRLCWKLYMGRLPVETVLFLLSALRSSLPNIPPVGRAQTRRRNPLDALRGNRPHVRCHILVSTPAVCLLLSLRLSPAHLGRTACIASAHPLHRMPFLPPRLFLSPTFACRIAYLRIDVPTSRPEDGIS